ncbi:MAG: hypothetical protein KDA84_17355 [Planctomycetaceae bacterium]|nr:hypothetical protein [Planctomycetaceae bacterium]
MTDRELSRRQFGKQAATTAVLGSLVIGGSDSKSIANSSEDPAPAIAEPIPPQSIPIDLLLLEVVRQMYPDRKLTHDILREIRRDIRSDLRRAKAIRSVPLHNGNEPAGLFAAYHPEESENPQD